MTITPLKGEHVRAVAAMHVRELTGLLRALGAPAARAFYAGCVESPNLIGFVALDRGEVRGFACGSMLPRALKLEAIARKPIAFTVGVALGILRRPAALPYVLQLFRGSAGTHDAGEPELTYLAVAPEARRGGIGKDLVNAFSAALRAKGARAYELSVERDNIAADAFYRRLGFKNVGNYHEFGVDHRRYSLDIHATSA
jgi:ribosomal protein S18 acetylase RimI-like enzyme